jgi:hypothetical protein
VTLASRARWGDRLLGAAVGAAVVTFVLWPGDEPPAAQTTVAQTPVPETPVPETPVAEARPPEAPVPETPVPEAPVPAEPEPAAVPPPSVTERADGPDLPLSHLPGSRVAHRKQRFDPEARAWVLTETVRVVAPGAQVVAYYSKALEDLELRVRRVEEPATDRWSMRTTLKGRAEGRVVQIALRQAADEMRTTARIIWKVDADETTG